MKKYFFLIMIVVLAISGCSLFAPKPSSIQEVEEFRAKDIGDSGASEVPSNEGEVVQVFASIDTDTDPLLKDIFNSNDAKSLFSQRALKYAKSLGSSFASQIAEIQGDIEDFPTTKQIDATINLSVKPWAAIWSSQRERAACLQPRRRATTIPLRRTSVT
jgi:hypothetical protein